MKQNRIPILASFMRTALLNSARVHLKRQKVIGVPARKLRGVSYVRCAPPCLLSRASISSRNDSPLAMNASKRLSPHPPALLSLGIVVASSSSPELSLLDPSPSWTMTTSSSSSSMTTTSLASPPLA